MRFLDAPWVASIVTTERPPLAPESMSARRKDREDSLCKTAFKTCTQNIALKECSIYPAVDSLIIEVDEGLSLNYSRSQISRCPSNTSESENKKRQVSNPPVHQLTLLQFLQIANSGSTI